MIIIATGFFVILASLCKRILRTQLGHRRGNQLVLLCGDVNSAGHKQEDALLALDCSSVLAKGASATPAEL